MHMIGEGIDGGCQEISHNKDSTKDAIVNVVLSARTQHNLVVFWELTVQQRETDG